MYALPNALIKPTARLQGVGNLMWANPKICAKIWAKDNTLDYKLSNITLWGGSYIQYLLITNVWGYCNCTFSIIICDKCY